MRWSLLIPIVAVAAVVAAAIFWMGADDPVDSRLSDVGRTAANRQQSGPTGTGGPAAPAAAPGRARSQAAASAREALQAERRTLDPQIVTAFGNDLDAYLALVNDLQTAREAGQRSADGDDAEADRLGERLAALRTRLIRAMQEHPGLSLSLLDAAGSGGERRQLALARVLRFARHPRLVTALAHDATSAGDPLRRRVALVALEGRPTGEWLAPVRTAWSQDDDAGVRQAAAGVLGRSLADPRLGTDRAAVSRALLGGVDSPSASDRVAVMEALLTQRRLTEPQLQAVRGCERDPDPAVRAAAARVLRRHAR